MEGWPTLRAAAIQPNVPQEVKWDPAFVDETYRRLATLTLEAAESEPDLVVWPESAVPGYLRYDTRARGLVTGLSRTIETPIFTGTNDADTLAGASGEEPADYRVFNAAYLVSGDSILPGRYAKRRLVPIAERVPFLPGQLSGFFEKLSDWTGQFAPGEGWTTWTVDGASFGVLICYESIFPGSSRALVRNGADFLLNITNDAWFGRTAAPYQHASHLTLRAVEHRVSFLRAANTGDLGLGGPRRPVPRAHGDLRARRGGRRPAGARHRDALHALGAVGARPLPPLARHPLGCRPPPPRVNSVVL